MTTRLTIAGAVVLFCAPALPILAAEHPAPVTRLPTTIQVPASGTQQPQAQAKEVSKADISAGIKKHIGSETKKSTDRKFHVKYGGKDLALDLIRVHDDRLSSIGGGKYFACVDMKAADSKTYDIDFFMTGQPGNIKVTETSVHKINSKPLYNWKEVNGIWKKVST
jgi:hypothetical protein